MNRFAWVLALALSVPATAAELAQVVRKCDSGNAFACAEAASMYRDGSGAPKDALQTAAFYIKACSLNDPGAENDFCHDAGAAIGEMERTRGGKDKLEAMFSKWSASCDAGKAMDCNFLGLVYQVGAGFDKDRDKSRQAYAKGCEKGAVQACSNAAYAYLEDPEDPAKVVYFLGKACDKSAGSDCALLGTMLEKGEGTEKNPKRAAEVYRRACDLGDGLGCASAGMMHYFGDGVAKDPLAAVIDLKKACDLGEKRGCLGLGTIYRNDKAAAKKLFAQACAKTGGCDDFRELMAGIDSAGEVKNSH